MFAQKTRGLSLCVLVRRSVCRAGGCVVGCKGCRCVSMVLTEVDNCSNDCGGRGGSAVSGTSRRRCRAAWSDMSQLLCLSVT